MASSSNQTSPSITSNWYILREGTLIPNTVFVGGINMEMDEREIRDVFTQFGSVREVKIITSCDGICKGYGFVYYDEDVDVQTIIEQQICIRGKTLKLGHAIVKARNSPMYSNQPHLEHSYNPPCFAVWALWENLTEYVYALAQGDMAQPMHNAGNPYALVLKFPLASPQRFYYSSPPGAMHPQICPPGAMDLQIIPSGAMHPQIIPPGVMHPQIISPAVMHPPMHPPAVMHPLMPMGYMPNWYTYQVRF